MPENPLIQQRKVVFCETLQSYPLARLLVQCSSCNRFFAACCPDGSFGDDWALPHDDDHPTCHHSKLVYTDGACTNNGSPHAKAGLGITIGGEHTFEDLELKYSWSIPVDGTVDAAGPRTSQRAELLAALEGLKKLEKLDKLREASGYEDKEHTQLAMLQPHKQFDRATYIVVTDSEYVVKGITEWFPTWRRRGWRTSYGKEPTNLDLFMKLDEYVTTLEDDKVAVGFWHIPRELNRNADALAKRATGA
ncbi:ribonuclease H-like domain-containing protein [Gymnopilus junonius]|uniref:ribonuclease H n=1 Tax=Gymnopilus junonius TaxID=109634 RepID=A0A9P5NEY3_GYMJU|nr:ribonuclease H-like domain-containing protein [Gymnopilus junonius]